MKKTLITMMLPLCAITLNAQTTPAKKTAAPVKTTTTVKKTTVPVKKAVAAPAKKVVSVIAFKSTLDSASYALGNTMATNMKKDGLNALNYDLLVKGFKDAFGDATPLLTLDKSQEAINNLFIQVNRQKHAPAINEGKAFLEKNKLQTGVQETPSGLQYQVINRGTGVRPLATDTVLVNYRGTLLNGTQFDSSYDRNEPVSFPLDRVISGWTEGVQLMQAGSKYKFFVPYQLAYGERAQGADIPAYSTLIFEIELLKVNGK